MSASNDDLFNNGIQALRRWYREWIRDHVAGILADMKRGDMGDDLDEFNERVQETVDGCEIVIYTRLARAVPLCSDYDWQSDWDDMGYEKAPTTEQIAYLCVLNDVREEIGDAAEEYFESRDDEE